MSSKRATVGGAVPDAGTEQRRARGDGVDEVGAIVVDADDDSPDRDEAVVINTPPVAVEDWEVGRDDTVADHNPAYDHEAEVIVVAFRAELEAAHPEWEPPSAIELPADCRTYAFPPRRLRRVGYLGEEHVDETGGSAPSERLTDAQRDLRERLGGGDVDVVPDPTDAERAVLVVEKLGEEYRIDADGAVEGGAVAGRLREVAAEYLGGDAGE